MNWLSHVLLSEQKIDFQLGNYLADPLKGKAWEGASEELKQGIEVHKRIDIYTDTHAIFSQSKNRIRDKGLLRGVVMDLTYDYLLTKHWEKFSHIPKEEFLKEFYDNAMQRSPLFPTKPQRLVYTLVTQDRLNKYNSMEELHKAFSRIDLRLSPKLLARESASSYMEDVVRAEKGLEEDFLAFFPQLQKHIKAHMDPHQIEHWRSDV
jgi:acyl carrier protein phosphodiesterase